MNLTKNNEFYDRIAGGAKSEVNFREEFWDAGMRIEEPSISDVQTGIDRVYGLISQKRLHIASNLDSWWDEVYSYQYETDPDTGDVLPDLDIKSKSRYHMMDATRYLASLFGVSQGSGIARGGGDRVAVSSYRQKQMRVLGLQEVRDSIANISMPETNSGRVARASRSQDIQGHSPRRRSRAISLRDD